MAFKLKGCHPATGLVHRIDAYYLDNGYWDCNREDELQAAYPCIPRKQAHQTSRFFTHC